MTATVHHLPRGTDEVRTAELSLLSAMMWGGQTVLRLIDGLAPDDFTSTSRGTVYAALRSLLREHDRLEPSAAMLMLHRRLGQLPSDVASDTIAVAVEACTAGGVPALARSYVDAILDAADANRVRRAAEAMVADPPNARLHAQELIDRPARERAAVLDAHDLSDETWRTYEAGAARGVSTGWRTVDEHLTVADAYLTVVGGWTHSGKSTWVDALAVNLAELHGWRTLVWSPENWPYGQHHVPRLIQRRMRAPFHDGPTPRLTADDLAAGQAWVHDHFRWLDPTVTRTADDIMGAADALMRRSPYQLLVIDPFTEVTRPAGERLHDFVYDFLGLCSAFVDRHRCHVMVVAHPRKPQAGHKGPPGIYDIADSAHWGNRADVIVMVHRMMDNRHHVMLDVQKVRHRNVGVAGHVTLRFDPVTWRFHDLAGAEQSALRKDWDA